MKYSVYFEKVREIGDTNPQLAESLLQEAESYASQVVLEHLVLCARGRKHISTTTTIKLWDGCISIMSFREFAS